MTKTQTDRQKLRNDHPDSWVAVDPGDVLIGRVTDIVDAWSDKRNNLKGGNYPLITVGSIEEATGYDNPPSELKVHCFGSVLFNEAMRKRPQTGERIRFIYKGQGKDKRNTGNPPELYSITVASKAASARAYDSIERSERQQQAAPTPEPVQPELSGMDANDDDIPF